MAHNKKINVVRNFSQMAMKKANLNEIKRRKGEKVETNTRIFLIKEVYIPLEDGVKKSDQCQNILNP